jgi:hypothetical protein
MKQLPNALPLLIYGDSQHDCSSSSPLGKVWQVTEVTTRW